MTSEQKPQEHVLGEDGQFHVEDAPIDLSGHGWEDWLTLALFWALAAVVFIQFFTRYALNDSAGWTEEIARYLLIATVFIGASISVRKNNHIQVDVFYQFMPRRLARLLSTAMDLVKIAFFGYAKGAFSGAVRSYQGLLSAAGGGTVFLDEIDDTPHALQVKLLRVLEDRVVTRLGESSAHQVDFRLRRHAAG